MTDAEIIQAAIDVIQREIVGEGCDTWDYEDFKDEPDISIGRDINNPSRCYCCAAKQVVIWLKDYLADEEEC